MTPEQTKTLIACIVVVCGLIYASYKHFKVVYKDKRNPFECCTKSFFYLEGEIKRANWLQLNELWLMIQDFTERYSGRIDQSVFKKYIRQLHRAWYRRRMEVAPRTGEVKIIKAG